jgi:hypothetical protein
MGCPGDRHLRRATDRRRQPHGTIGVLHIADGELLKTAIVEVT